MARIRTIKPEFPQSETIGKLSRDARLLFIQLWTLVDDDGRTRAASRMLASLLYPYDDDAPSLIEGWLVELEAQDAICRYVVDGSVYLEIPNWLKHQKIDKPSKSKIPQFDEASRLFSKPREEATTDLGPRTRTMDLDQDQDAALLASANDCRILEGKLRQAGGLENAISPALADVSSILGLIDAGFDLETEIIPTVRAKSHPKVRTWKFFVDACHDSRAARQAAATGAGHSSARAPPPDRRNKVFEALELNLAAMK